MNSRLEINGLKPIMLWKKVYQFTASNIIVGARHYYYHEPCLPGDGRSMMWKSHIIVLN